MSQRWSLPVEPRSAGLARSLVAEALAGRAFVDDAVLVASELVTNALEHGAGPLELGLDLEGRVARIEVTNGGAGGEPIVQVATPDDEGGRGLAITQALAADWGWERLAGRMSVWAEFPTDLRGHA